MERIGFPQEAVDTIGDCTERVSENADFNALVDEFIAHPENLDSVLERLKALSEQLGENEYTMNMCLLLGACPALRERYAEKGIDEAIFWKTEDKDIIVVPSKTVPQGITAIINYMPDADAQTNLEAMIEGIGNVKTGQVTYAVRDTHIDDKEIHQGDIMGIGDAGILSVGQDIAETTLEMLEQLVDDDSELISLYYGQDVTEEEADAFTQEVEKLYPDIDVDVHCGGQPIYYYVLAVE
mgnify:CR=1 FL=1